MSEPRLVPGGAGEYRISGELSFYSVPALWREAAQLFGTGRGPLRFDLRDVDRSDSAGLALLVDWMRTAGRHGQDIEFRNVPAQILSVAEVSGLTDVLPIARA